MAKPSVSESTTTPQASARDALGNQSHGDGSTSASSAAASASREIFQGLFKDLGKQAMAMESILRLVCGKVDKLEHWVTEMSFGMTELDLKLRNIAHNIEGTAANVDDVASVSRWAVPEEDEAKAATATVVKKVGVGLHKKKQMRMTGMVANILDQLTTVAETPMVESENEAHKGEDGGKKKKGKKAKDREKAKARGEHASGGGDPVMSSKDNSPREAETKEKHKAHKKKKSEQQQRQIQPHEEMVDEIHQGQDVAGKEDIVEKGVSLPHQEVEEKGAETREDAVQHEDAKQNPLPHEDLQEDTKAEKTEEKEEQTLPAKETPDVLADEITENEDVAAAIDAQREREPQKPQEIEPMPENTEDTETAEAETAAEIASMDVEDDAKQLNASRPTEATQLSLPEQLVIEEKGSSDQDIAPTTNTSATESTASMCSLSSREGAVSVNVPQTLNPRAVEQAPAVTLSLSIDPVQASQVERATILSPIPSSRAPIDDVVAQVTPSLPEPTIEPLAPQQHLTPATRPDLPPVRLEPLVIPEAPVSQKTHVADDAVLSPEPNPPATVELDLNSTVETASTALNEAFQPKTLRTKTSSKRLRLKNAPTSTEGVAEAGGRPSPTKTGSRKALIRQPISQRQPSLKKRRSQLPAAEPPVVVEDTKIETTVSPAHPTTTIATGKPAVVTVSNPKTSSGGTGKAQGSQMEDSQDDDDEEEEDDDDDDDDDDSSALSSDSGGSVLDLGGSGNSGAAADTKTTPADKKMSSKMTRTLTALNKLKKANVLSVDEIAELKERATQKWFRLRDHVKEKNKKDVTNILLKRKKNIFTVSNRIELLEEKSREVYASIKQLNTELKSKIEASTADGLRRQVQDINASLQVLDQKISKGDIPTMEHVKQLATETENLRLMFLEQLAYARDHCDANHDETLKMFEDEWKRVAEMQKNMEDKLETLAKDFDGKILALPDYADALEGIRRAIRKKADVKTLRELEAKLLGHEEGSEDCLIRCLSCHKEVTNTNSHDATNNGEDNDVSVASSPHFKRVNPGTASAKVCRSNMPLNAQPLVISESTPELFTTSQTDGVTTPNAKSVTPSRRASRNEETRPSPLSFIHVTATRAMAAAADASRPISAPSVAIKKKPQPTSGK